MKSINNLAQGIYTLRSKSLGYNNPPFIADSDESAQYQVRGAVKKEGSFLAEQKDDLTLVRVGTWSSREKCAILDNKSEFEIDLTEFC